MVTTVRKLGATDIKYKIICAGSKFHIGFNQPVVVQYNGRMYQAKMHSTSKGRIDGLGKMFSDFSFSEGQELTLNYHEDSNIIEILGGSQQNKSSDFGCFDVNSNSDEEDVFIPNFDIYEKKTPKNNLKKEECGVSQSELVDIFSKMDPVVQHNEFYLQGREPIRTYVSNNREWIVYGGNQWGDEFYLLNERTLRKIPLDIPKGYHNKGLLGVNTEGVWFVDYRMGKLGDEVQAVLECVVPYENYKVNKIKFNKNRNYVKDIYINGTKVFYISCSEYKETLREVTLDGCEYQLFVASKGEHIDRLSAINNNVLFRFSSSEMSSSGWYLIDINLYNGFNKQWVFFGTNNIGIKIYMIDMEQKRMWTTITDAEAMQLGVYSQRYDIWLCRPLEEPQEGRYFIHGNNKPIMWNRGTLGERDIRYFDGEVMYTVPHYSKLRRIQEDGTQIELSGGGHGECDKIIVSKQYLYVNYDASMPVQLPKKFHASEQYAKDNWEANAIWGEEDFRF